MRAMFNPEQWTTAEENEQRSKVCSAHGGELSTPEAGHPLIPEEAIHPRDRTPTHPRGGYAAQRQTIYPGYSWPPGPFLSHPQAIWVVIITAQGCNLPSLGTQSLAPRLDNFFFRDLYYSAIERT